MCVNIILCSLNSAHSTTEQHLLYIGTVTKKGLSLHGERRKASRAREAGRFSLHDLRGNERSLVAAWFQTCSAQNSTSNVFCVLWECKALKTRFKRKMNRTPRWMSRHLFAADLNRKKMLFQTARGSQATPEWTGEAGNVIPPRLGMHRFCSNLDFFGHRFVLV